MENSYSANNHLCFRRLNTVFQNLPGYLYISFGSFLRMYSTPQKSIHSREQQICLAGDPEGKCSS